MSVILSQTTQGKSNIKHKLTSYYFLLLYSTKTCIFIVDYSVQLCVVVSAMKGQRSNGWNDCFVLFACVSVLTVSRSTQFGQQMNGAELFVGVRHRSDVLSWSWQ